MSLQSNLSSAFTRVATEFKTVYTRIGALGDLTTTNKTNLVAAVNEVRAAAASATGINDETTTTTTTWSSSKINSNINAAIPNWSTLSGKPSTFAPIIGTTAVTAKAGNYVPSWVEVTGKPSFAAVATSGSYADLTGTVPTSALPPLAINEIFPVATQAAMLALTAQRGDMAIRTDNGLTYVLASDAPATLADWKEITTANAVTSVAGRTGIITLTKSDVGLANVDNTSDAAKPISTATSTALAGKAATSHTHTAANISDSTPVGRSLLAAADAAAARTAIGAGTSSLDLGATASTAAPGNHTHTHASLTDTTAIGTQVATAATAAAIRSLIGAGTGNSNLAIGTTGTTAAAGNHTHVSANITDTTTVGRAVMMAASTTAARSAIGAGTSSLVIGATAGTAQDSAAVGDTEVDLVALFEAGLAA